jgi:hypothetical protein
VSLEEVRGELNNGAALAEVTGGSLASQNENTSTMAGGVSEQLDGGLSTALKALGVISKGVDAFLNEHQGRCKSAEDASAHFTRAGEGSTNPDMEALVASSIQHAQAVGELGGRAIELQLKAKAMAIDLQRLTDEVVEIRGDAANLDMQAGVERQAAFGLSRRARDIADSL